MRELKFKFVVKNEFTNRVAFSPSYTLDELIDDISTEDILCELDSGCDGNSSCQVNGVCECNADFEDGKIIAKLQYTGLKDKNGVEIYEGDILSNNMCVRKLSKVVWEEHGARFICKEFLNGAMCHWAKNFPYLTVVGNIHTNPELLEQTK